ncbi:MULTISPECIES: hypothetical protein [unclassified Moorena]|nr:MULTISPECIES: hypothetical protein [unclassified Moorena]
MSYWGKALPLIFNSDKNTRIRKYPLRDRFEIYPTKKFVIVAML